MSSPGATITGSATERLSQADLRAKRGDAIPAPEHVSTIERWFEELFLRGDLDAVDGLVAPDFVAHGQGGMEDRNGREAFREWLRWHLSAFADREWTVHVVISEGDRAVVRYSGWTNKGSLLDIPSTDQRVLETGILILRVRDGLVQELWSEMSDLQLVVQLGAFQERGEDR